MVDVLLVDKKSHSLLTLICDNLLGRQCLVANRQFCHVNLTTTFLNKFRKTVDMSGRTVVVDADNRIDILLTEGSHEVVGALLHLGVGTLNGIQFDAIAIATGINR